MRKIKRFRIPIYTYDILRRAKKRRIDLFALGLAEQESAKEYISSLAAALEPSTVFDRLPDGDEIAGRIGLAGPPPGTLGVITLGQSFEAKLGEITEPGLSALAETAAQVFADTGLKVVAELVDQEISAEGLSMGAPARLFSFGPAQEEEERSAAAPAQDPDLAAACLARLSADKISVAMNGGVLSPKHTLLFSIPWLAPRKKKPAAGAAPRQK